MGLPVCLQERSDCFSFRNGRCECLSNTAFKDKNRQDIPCPFFKTKEQHERDLEKYPYNPFYGMMAHFDKSEDEDEEE